MSAIAETATGHSPLGAMLRRHDYDRYLMGLFAPSGSRDSVWALYAFNYEIARIREAVREPMLGQIRLQWWREGIDAAFAGSPVRRHEVLTPLAAAIRDRGLSRDPFDRLIDAREHDLRPEPPATVAALESYAEESAAPLQLLVLAVLDAAGAAANRAAREAAIAYALVGLVRAAPFLARSGRRIVPQALLDEAQIGDKNDFFRQNSAVLIHISERILDRAAHHLAAARDLRGEVSHAAFPALLPAVLAAADIARLRRAGCDPLAPRVVRRDPWRAWRLTLASVTGWY